MKNYILLSLLFQINFSFSQNSQKKIAITIDDLPFVMDISLKETQADSKKMQEHLKKYNIKACVFINEGKLEKNNETAERANLLEDWIKNGHLLGNHTFSHISFNANSLENYKTDFLKGERVTLKLMEKYKQTRKYYRYPYLQAGNDSLKKYGFLKFLAEQNYINAPVTIDNEDYIFNKVYVDAYKKGDVELMKKTADEYLKYLERLFDYFEEMSEIVENRQINQIFLCHANKISADHFDKVFDLMQKKGYKFISLDEALSDKVYQNQENYVGKGGFSWLHRWKITKNIKFDKPEPQIDPVIMELYGK